MRLTDVSFVPADEPVVNNQIVSVSVRVRLHVERIVRAAEATAI